MAWKGEAEEVCYGMSHKGICPLLSLGLREAMVGYLRAALSAEPEGGT